MADDWYCKIDACLAGPLLSCQLKQLAQEGKLQPAHLVRKGREGRWVRADKVRGLFDDTAARPSEQPAPPNASTTAGRTGPPPILRDGGNPSRQIWGRRTLATFSGVGLAALVIGSVLFFSREGFAPRAPSSASTPSTAVAPTARAVKPQRSMPLDEFLAETVQTATVPPAADVKATDNSRSQGAPQKAGVLSPEQLFALASPAVVKITTKNEDGKILGHGSGFLIGSNELNSPEQDERGKGSAGFISEVVGKPMRVAYVCTNYHVIEAALEASIELPDGTTGDVASVLAQSAESDLAVLEAFVETEADPKVLGLAREVPVVGISVCAIGSPLDLDYSLSDGIISNVRTAAGDTIMLQTTAAISPGSSGGPLLSMAGKVVGITTATRIGGQNLNFAVSCLTLRTLLDGTYDNEGLWRGKSYLKLVNEASDELKWALLRSTPREEEVEFDASRAEWAILKARDLCRDDKYEEAVKLLKQHRDPLPEEYQYLEKYILGEAYSGLVDADWAKQIPSLPRDQYDDASSMMHAAVRRAPHFDDAIRCFEAAASLKPTFAPAHARLTHYRAQAGQWVEALAAADFLVSLVPNCAKAYALRAKCYDNLAGYDGKRAKDYGKKLQLAAADYSRATDLNPRDAGSYFQLGQVLSSGLLGHDEAIHAFERAVDERVQGAFACYHGMAFAYAGLGNFDRAEQCLALSLKHGVPQAHYDDSLDRIRRKKRGLD